MHLIDISCRGRAALLCLVAVAALLASGCVYRVNIQQGNFLDPAALEQLSVGMTRSQVRYLLGTPMLPDAFDTDRWDYMFYYKRGRWKSPEKRQVTVFFEDEKVVRIERPGIQSSQVAAAEAAKSEAAKEEAAKTEAARADAEKAGGARSEPRSTEPPPAADTPATTEPPPQ